MRKKILVVDDNLTNLTLAKSILANHHDPIPAPSGAVALKLTARFAPDLVFLDIQMPDMDGFETLKGLREKGVTCPVYFLTGLEEPGLEEKVRALGAQGLIMKPFNENDLMRACE